jgi:hypothetical protein
MAPIPDEYREDYDKWKSARFWRDLYGGRALRALADGNEEEGRRWLADWKAADAEASEIGKRLNEARYWRKHAKREARKNANTT